MSRSDSSKDYYSVLGVEADASRGEIDRQYKRQAARHHPDLGGSEEQMKCLNEAYGVLKDQAARRDYDAGRTIPTEVSFAPASAPASGTATPTAGGAASSPAPSADTLYSNGLRDITSGKYDLAHSEFQDYLKYYGDTDLASNAQFYLGEISFKQKQYGDAVAAYEKVLTNYPKSFKLAPARLRKGMALIELGQKNNAVREFREVVRRYPGTEEDRQARAKLKELGVAVTATR